MKKVTTWQEYKDELEENPKYRKAARQLKPYFDVSSFLIKQRIELDLSEKDMANKLGLSLRMYRDIEAANHNTKLSVLAAMAEALDKTVNVSFSESETK